jgi:hypothetical protein
MGQEKRGRKKPVPYGFEQFLTPEQAAKVREQQALGWSLAFIRRPLILKPTVVLTDPDTDRQWSVEADGTLAPFHHDRSPSPNSSELAT